MNKGRLEAFSDGVIAIVLTIMVLELKAPHEGDALALRPLAPAFLSYVLSFIYIGIYWNNHHHLLHAAHGVNGAILWANLHLLFWLSLVPVATAWMGETRFAALPVALYGIPMLGAGVAYTLLTRALIAHHGADSTLAKSIGGDFKGKASLVVYLAAIPLAFVAPWISCACYVLVAIVWLIPDRRIERALER
jgi:uncharacterized membrane protein